MKDMENVHFDIFEFIIKDDGIFPNSLLPVLVYKSALTFESVLEIEEIFKKNKWIGKWRNGIYNYHHYHSTAHETLGVYKGSATVLLGGQNGIIQKIQKGDVLIIPAGVAHKCIESSNDFKCIGAYPENQEEYDINCGRLGERPQSDRNIENVPLPTSDPLSGNEGLLIQYWKKRSVELKLVTQN